MGLGGLEPPTSRLSGVRSNQLSYRPTPRNAAEAREPVEAVDESSPAGVPARLGPGLRLQKRENSARATKAREA